MAAIEKPRMGLDLGGTKLSGIVLAPDGEMLAARRVSTPRDDYAATLTTVFDLVRALESDAGLGGKGTRIGMGTPGSWQARGRAMKNCNSTWLNGRPLLDDMRAGLGPRVRIANDADCFALSEARDGAGQGSRSLFGVIIGTGVGGGLVVEGSLLRGARGLAGEWGHTPLPYFLQAPFVAGREDASDAAQAAIFQLESRLSHRPCYCGRLNCIETFLSGPGLTATHRALWGETRSPETIARAAREAEQQSLLLYANMLARSLAQMVNVFDPDTIVLGGGLSNMERLYALVGRELPRFLFASDPRELADEMAVSVKPARWGDDSGVRGAAWLWDATE